MAEHQHGSMDISEHEKTFDNFMRICTRMTIGILVFLVFLAIVNG